MAIVHTANSGKIDHSTSIASNQKRSAFMFNSMIVSTIVGVVSLLAAFLMGGKFLSELNAYFIGQWVAYLTVIFVCAVAVLLYGSVARAVIAADTAKNAAYRQLLAAGIICIALGFASLLIDDNTPVHESTRQALYFLMGFGSGLGKIVMCLGLAAVISSIGLLVGGRSTATRK